MWVNTLSRKSPLLSRQIKASSCKGKTSDAVQEGKVTIPDSWELSENQRHFIESFIEPKTK